VENLGESFDELAKELETLPEAQPDSKTAFELLSEANSEVAWQSYLAYFIDPDEAHGLEDDFLREFLDFLSEMDGIPELPYHSRTSGRFIDIQTEYQSSGDRPDILILNEGDWYVCAELKVESGENKNNRGWQTVRYSNNPDIVPSGIDEYEEGAYVYIAPSDAKGSKSGEFADIGWGEVSSHVRKFLSENAMTIPGRTASQLEDFATTIENETAMTDIDSATREKKELYFEYRDEISDIEDSVEDFVDRVLKQEWGNELEDEFEPESAQEYEWIYKEIGNPWAHVVTPSWERGKENLELDIHFEHKPKEKYFKEGQLKLLLEIEEPDRGTSDPEEGDRYYAFRQDVIDSLNEADYSVEGNSQIDPTRNGKKLYRAVYQFPPGDEEEYYSTLSQAIDEHTWIVDLVNQLLEEKDYEEYPLSVD